MSKILKNKDSIGCWNSREVINTPPTEIVEENVFIDENFLKNKDLIRIDLNLIQFPIFSKNTHRKVNQIVKYYFNKSRDTYITVTPQAGDYIPGEMEEKVFIALMQIMKERDMKRKIIISSVDLREKLKMKTGAYLEILSKALSRLGSTNYTFKNTLYSSEFKGILDRKIETSIFNITTIALDEKKNMKYREMYKDKRIKVIYEIEFSEHFYSNIIQKGYMVYNGNTLLGIESTVARTLYMLVEKLRFDKLYLKLDTVFLIKRIPLKDDKKNLNKTIKTLENAFQELVDKELISSFNFVKESTWEKSEVEMFFSEISNIEKQNRFFGDRNDFRKLITSTGVSGTEHQMIEEVEVINPKNKSIEELVNKILDLMPSKAKELKTMPRTIRDSLEKYGYSKVEATAIYMRQQKVEKPRTYFIKALENDWLEDNIKIVNPTRKELRSNFQDTIPTYNESLYKEFEKLPIEVQNGIEGYAYREYIKICGIETKIQQLAFAGSRKKNICEYLEKYPEILGNFSFKQEENIDKKVINEIKKVREIIENSIELADILYKYSEEEKNNILAKILKDVIPLFNKTELTENKLNEIIEKYMEL
ncbi:MAG: hypothetical protein ACRCY7_02170 [Cetobacterium sp.]|uniref:hypothetical protein n=1 Tax=Cetobacterium sp. TaxID=2071632 RepID=UPI003F40000F